MKEAEGGDLIHLHYEPRLNPIYLIVIVTVVTITTSTTIAIAIFIIIARIER